MKILLATALTLSAMTTVTIAQQFPAPATTATPALQTAPAIPSPTAVPEVLGSKDTPPPGLATPTQPHPGDWQPRKHRGHMPPPPPSKAAHFRIKSGSTIIDIKCAEDEPTKVCADVLNQVMEKLGPTSRSNYDSDDGSNDDVDD